MRHLHVRCWRLIWIAALKPNKLPRRLRRMYKHLKYIPETSIVSQSMRAFGAIESERERDVSTSSARRKVSIPFGTSRCTRPRLNYCSAPAPLPLGNIAFETCFGGERQNPAVTSKLRLPSTLSTPRASLKGHGISLYAMFITSMF